MVFGLGKKKQTSDSIENLKKLKQLLEALRRNDTILNNQKQVSNNPIGPNDMMANPQHLDRETKSNADIIHGALQEIEKFEEEISRKVGDLAKKVISSGLDVSGDSLDKGSDNAKKQLEDIKQQLRRLIQQ